MLQESNIDILVTCETFLYKTDDDRIVNIKLNGFTIERKDRDSCPDIKTNKNGGILIYLRDKLEYVRRHDLELPDLESIWIEIKSNSVHSVHCIGHLHLQLTGQKYSSVKLKDRLLQTMKYI